MKLALYFCMPQDHFSLIFSQPRSYFHNKQDLTCDSFNHLESNDIKAIFLYQATIDILIITKLILVKFILDSQNNFYQLWKYLFQTFYAYIIDQDRDEA